MTSLSITRTPLTQRAFQVALAAHEGQVRKYTMTAYVIHPMRVARAVVKATDDDVLTAAALLHDVVEDTPVTLEQIDGAFGYEVARLVNGVTTAGRYQGNRDERKRQELDQLKKSSPGVQSIKLADIADNCRDLVALDPRFAEVYLPEKMAQILAMTDGNKMLRDEAFDVVQKAMIKLEAMKDLALA